MTDRLATRDMKTALSFDGVDDYVDTGFAAVNTNALTISGWVKIKKVAATQVILSNFAGDYAKRIWWEVSSSADALQIRINGGTMKTIYVNGVLNKQLHVVQVINTDGSVDAYINSIHVGTLSASGDGNYGDGQIFSFGRNGTENAHYYQGVLDEARIFNRALTADEVKALYTYGIVPRENLVAEYLFDEGAGTTALDTSGNGNDGTISGAVYTSEVPFKPGLATRKMTHSLSFDGVDDYVDCGTLDVTAWTAITIHQRVLVKDTGTKILFSLLHSGGDDIRIINQGGLLDFTLDDGSVTSVKATPISKIQGKWADLVAVFDGTTMSMYIDGVLVESGVGNFDFAGASGETTIGGRGADFFFSGSVAETRIWNTGLTAQEVSDLYYHNIVPDSCVAEYFNSDTDGAGTVLTDSVGSNDGTISGATWSTEVPLDLPVARPERMPHVLRYDGVDDNTNLGSGLDLGGVPFVIHMKDISLLSTTAKHFFIAKDVESNRSFAFGVNGTTGNKIYAERAGASVGDSARSLPLQKKFSITFAYDGTNLSEYVDGVLWHAVAMSSLPTVGGNVTIGQRAYTTAKYNVNATIGETIIYKGVTLTPTEIYNLHHYNIIPETGLVGNWDRISDDGTKLLNSADPTGATDGTISGATRVTEPLALGSMPRKAVVPYVGSVYNDQGAGGNVVVKEDKIIGGTENFTIRGVGYCISPGDDTIYGERGDTGVDICKLEIMAGNKPQLTYRDDAGNLTQITGGSATPNGWYDYVAIREGSDVRIYINATLVGTGTMHASTTNNFTNANIESRVFSDKGGGFFNGYISDVRVYKTALTTAEVEQLYLTNTTPWDNDPSICVLNLEAKTDVLSGSSWRDVSGNGNHGAITGATLSSEAPSKARKQIDGNLVYNGDFSVRPYLVAATTTDDRWIDGTDGGTDGGEANSWPFYWGMNGGGGGTYAASFVTKDGRNALCIETTSASAYIEVIGGKRGGISDRKIIPVKSNTTYRYKVTMKTQVISGDATNGAWMNLLEVNSANTGIVSNNTPFIKTDTDWTTYTVEFTTNSATVAIEPRMQVYGHQGDADLIMKAWFSDITLTEV